MALQHGLGAFAPVTEGPNGTNSRASGLHLTARCAPRFHTMRLGQAGKVRWRVGWRIWRRLHAWRDQPAHTHIVCCRILRRRAWDRVRIVVHRLATTARQLDKQRVVCLHALPEIYLMDEIEEEEGRIVDGAQVLVLQNAAERLSEDRSACSSHVFPGKNAPGTQGRVDEHDEQGACSSTLASSLP